MRILIVDDDPAMGAALQRGLRRSGWVVETETSARRGLARHADDPYDVVVTDIFMPVMDGLELIRALRRSAAPPKIVAISGGPSSGKLDVLPLSAGLGADATIRKPFLCGDLIDLIARWSPAAADQAPAASR